MTAAPLDSPLYRAALAGLVARAAGPADPAPLRALRQQAAAWFRTHGFPHPRQEAWRFTPLRTVTDLPLVPLPRAANGVDYGAVERAQLDPRQVARVVVAGGHGRLLDGAPPPGVEVSSYRDLAERQPELAASLLDGGTQPVTAFSALNSALFAGGVVVKVAAGQVVERPLQLTVASAADRQAAVDLPRVLVLAEPGSQLGLIETHAGGGSAAFLSNSVLQVRVGAGAQVEHTRLEHGNQYSHRVGLLDVRLARDSRYVSRAFTLGGAFSRVDLQLHFDGPGAAASLVGLYLASGKQQVGHHTLIDHAHPDCSSHQSYRGMVDDQARAVFDGIVTVRAGAQRSRAHQENRNLLLSDQAVINAKPHLEIDADDVECSHGASVGQLDAEQLFYLRARGIAEAEARAMLAQGFVREVIEAIGFGPLREQVQEAVQAHLATSQGRSP
jgi:Fe-S cluster assembly protein SufD